MTARDRIRHACLAALSGAACAAFALAFEMPAAWALLALPAAALVLRVPPLPARLASALIWISRVLIFAAGALVANGFFEAAPAIGLALGMLSGLFLLDPRSFTAAGAFLPTALGVLLLAASNPSPRHLEPLTWLAAAALVSWIALWPGSAVRPRRLAALALFLLPAIAIGEGIARFLPWAQPHVEEKAFRLFSPAQAQSGIALGARLGSIEQLALSPQVILRMWSDEPMALRTGVYTEFDGRHWRAARAGPAPTTLVPGAAVFTPPEWTELVPGEWRAAPGPAASGPVRLFRVAMESSLHGLLPAPASVQAVRIPRHVRLDRFGVLSSMEPSPAVYGVSYVRGPQAAADGADSLHLPALDPRVAALARELGPEDAPAGEKMARTVSHLQARCRYSLNVGRWTTKDPLSEFLFDKKKGYCEYFATATVILLRLQGVPARYVNGLSVREQNRVGGHYLVRGADAHAWAEALLPGTGWVEVDATPADQYADLHAPMAPGPFERWAESLKARWTTLAARVRGADARLLLRGRWLWIVAAATFVLLWRRRRRRVSSSAPPPAPGGDVDRDFRECFHRLEQLWIRAGHARPRHRAPLEHARALPERHEALRSLSIDVVECFYRDAYGGVRVPSAEIARLRQAIETAGVS